MRRLCVKLPPRSPELTVNLRKLIIYLMSEHLKPFLQENI